MRTSLAGTLVLLSASLAVAGSPDFRSPPLGAAGLATNNIMTWGGYTLGGGRNVYAGHIWLDQHAPTEELTVCSWVAIHDADGAVAGSVQPDGTTLGVGGRRGSKALPHLYYCPNVERSAPDLLGGAWGWGGASVSVSGARSFDYAFPTVCDGWNGGATGTNCFPRGAYTVAWTNLTATMTLTAGGADLTLEAPAGVRNVEPGPAGGFILSGSGSGAVGISRMKVHPFYDTGRGQVSGSDMRWLDDRLVGTNWCFVAHRVRLDGSAHTNDLTIIQRDGTLYRLGGACELPPDGSAALGTNGWYQLVYSCIGDMIVTYVYEWDRRVFPRWLSDADLAAIFEDGCRVRDAFGYPDCVVTNAIYQEDP